MQVLGFLAIIFGPIMEWIYRFIPNYGWALIVFTLLVNLVLLPLRIKQQKSTARMSAFQPKMQEIQKKYAKDKNRQQEELMKFQQEYGFSMTAGCMPMALNFLFIFGIIEVVYRPMQYVLRIPRDLISQCVEMANSLGATPLMDLMVGFRRVAEVLGEKGIKIYKTLAGPYASTMNMPGFSFTLLKLDDELKELMDYPTDAPYFVQK